MSDSALVIGTILDPSSASSESSFAVNDVQEIVIRTPSLNRECMLASEESLESIWMTSEEDEAWKDL